MDTFLTWEVLKDYVTFVSIVFSIVAFTKNIPIIRSVPTRAWSVVVAYILMLAVNVHDGTFEPWNIILYFVNAILISAGANGLSDINSGGD